MSGRLTEIAGVGAWALDETGPALDEGLVLDILSETFSARVGLVIVPVSRLSPAFLDLKTRLAGEVLQKFVTYERRVAILGDISEAVARSAALRDFVGESNRGRSVWFVADGAELAAKLA
jgi:hypothetical protein